MRPSRIQNVLLIGLCLLAVAACGRKTLPVPPDQAVPAPVNDLRYHQEQSRIVLTWTPPKRTAVGSRLQGIDSFLVMRAVVPEDDYCPGCPVNFSTTTELPYDEAVSPDGKGRATARFIETLLRPGHRYLYRVRTKAGWRLISEDSNTVSFLWVTPAAPPAELTAEAGDRAVSLRWRPVKRTIDNAPLTEPITYRIYRGTREDGLRPVGAPVSGTSHIDRGLKNGVRYYYRVSAVRRAGGAAVDGMASRTVSALPRDITPPLPPRGVRAVKTISGIKIIWERGAEADIAGYRVYRRLPAEKRPAAIGAVAAGDLAFTDSFTPPKDVTEWYYAVSAYDVEANESVLSKEFHYESF